MEGVRLIDLPVHSDPRGSLTALDTDGPLGFVPARVVVLFDCPPSAVRAEHAVSADVALLAATGEVSIDLDNGFDKETVRLVRPDQALCVEGGIWMRLHSFKPGTTVVEAASLSYADSTYFDDPQPRPRSAAKIQR